MGNYECALCSKKYNVDIKFATQIAFSRDTLKKYYLCPECQKKISKDSKFKIRHKIELGGVSKPYYVTFSDPYTDEEMESIMSRNKILKDFILELSDVTGWDMIVRCINRKFSRRGTLEVESLYHHDLAVELYLLEDLRDWVRSHSG